MAYISFHDVQAPGAWTKMVSGHFASNGSSSPAVTSGTGWTVARTGTGVHTVTLTGGYGQILATVAGVQYAGAVDTIACYVTALDHNASTFSITTVSGASGAAKSAVDVGDDVMVHFTCVAQNTAVKP